ncbi:MAG: hypothetical protein M1830_005608 [Pleopsidium flavum]|nr:MAG: hypothetical protein M1830_005608 [Pleopsidium flavum]
MTFKPKLARAAVQARATKGDWIVPRHLHQSPPSRGFPFLKLPAELRNKIYDYVFEKHVLEILPLTRNRGLTHWDRKSKKSKPVLRKWRSLCVRGRSERQGRSERRLDKWPRADPLPGLAALLLTCKQIHLETHHLLYGQITFLFTSQAVLHRFMTALGPSCLGAIQSIKLQHHTHGEPYLQRNRVWKKAYDSKWAELCQQAAEKMTGLRELDIKLSICDWPTELNLKARWALPLLAFAGHQLKKAKVELELKGRCAEKARLRACAAVLERELMMPECQLSFEASGVKGGNEELPKAMRCLRIT